MRAKSAISTIRLVGLRNWLWYALRFDDARDYARRVRNCHSNARKLVQLEEKISDVQYACTDGSITDPYCTSEEFTQAIADQCARIIESRVRRARCPCCGKKGMTA